MARTATPYSGRVSSRSAKQTLTMIAYSRLKDEILALRLSPKQALVEAELAAMLEMSKTPVREALLMLHHDGLVELNDFKGARVRDLARSDAREIYELRAVLEPLALRLSHPHSTSADYTELRTVLDRAAACVTSGDRARLAELNRRFHHGLGARCRNSRLLTILGQVSDQVRLISMRGWVFHPTFGDEAVEHSLILEAVSDRDDVDGAATLLEAHIRRFAERHIDVPVSS